MANTLLNAVKDLRNDSLRDLVSVFAFAGETPAVATSPFQGNNYGYTSGGSINGLRTNIIDKISVSQQTLTQQM